MSSSAITTSRKNAKTMSIADIWPKLRPFNASVEAPANAGSAIRIGEMILLIVHYSMLDFAKNSFF